MSDTAFDPEFRKISDRARAALDHNQRIAWLRAMRAMAICIAERRLFNPDAVPWSNDATPEQRAQIALQEEGGKKFLNWTDEKIAATRAASRLIKRQVDLVETANTN